MDGAHGLVVSQLPDGMASGIASSGGIRRWIGGRVLDAMPETLAGLAGRDRDSEGGRQPLSILPYTEGLSGDAQSRNVESAEIIRTAIDLIRT